MADVHFDLPNDTSGTPTDLVELCAMQGAVAIVTLSIQQGHIVGNDLNEIRKMLYNVKLQLMMNEEPD